MKAEIMEELTLFCRAMCTGTVLLMVYDVLRIFRRVFPHEGLLRSAEDLLYWMFNTIFLFRMMYRESAGKIRGYVILGVIFGMLIYNLTVSPYVVNGISAILIRIKKIFEKIKKQLKNILKPITIKLCKYYKGKAGREDGKKSSEKTQ